MAASKIVDRDEYVRGIHSPPPIQDEESDDDLRARIRASLARLSPLGPPLSVVDVKDTANAFACLRDLPWSVIWIDRTERVVRVHFIDPPSPRIVQAAKVAMRSNIPLRVGLVVTVREPLCTVHSDCWEAGEEMRRACFASTRGEPGKVK